MQLAVVVEQVAWGIELKRTSTSPTLKVSNPLRTANGHRLSCLSDSAHVYQNLSAQNWRLRRGPWGGDSVAKRTGDKGGHRNHSPQASSS